MAAGHLVLPEILPLATNCTPPDESHSSMVSRLITHPRRNRLILDLVSGEAQAGRTVLVLSGRVKHCEFLADELQRRGITAEALTARVPKKRRSEILERFCDGSLKVVCATTLADEGLDVTRLERLVLATPARAEGRTVQRLGRLMRPHDGKGTPILFDLVDDTALARRQFTARKRAYRKVLGRDARIPNPIDAAMYSLGFDCVGAA